MCAQESFESFSCENANPMELKKEDVERKVFHVPTTFICTIFFKRTREKCDEKKSL